MSTALVGHTGFVGSNIHASRAFDDLYNTSNIADLDGKTYDLLVSAAGRADSFRINQHEEEDQAELDQLVDHLLAAAAHQLVVISTVCVYPWGGSPDEQVIPQLDGLTPYGRNRARMEQRLRAARDVLIVRLPQLYGNNMKKGVLFDLANNYRVEHIVPHRAFQYFDARELWVLIERALHAGIDTLNVATEPLTNEEVARDCYGIEIANQVPPEPESPYATMYTRDMTTRNASLLGGDGPYLWRARQVKERISAFAAELRNETAR